MSSVPESDFSFIRPLRPSKNPFSETELDIVHADTLDPLLRHDDALNAQEQERKNRYGGAKKRKRVLGDDGGRKITTKCEINRGFDISRVWPEQYSSSLQTREDLYIQTIYLYTFFPCWLMTSEYSRILQMEHERCCSLI
jgi:hypothetical protein